MPTCSLRINLNSSNKPFPREPPSLVVLIEFNSKPHPMPMPSKKPAISSPLSDTFIAIY